MFFTLFFFAFRDQAKSSPTTNTKSSLPTLKKTSSGGEPSKSQTYFVKTKWSPTFERPSSSFLPRVTLTGGSPHPYDIYDVPRPSPIPSPFNVKRITQSSTSACSSLHSVALTESTYDVPRSLIDLRQVDSPYPIQSVASSTKPSTYRSNSGIFHSSERLDQITMLKDAYPDYDIPKPSTIETENPDYDVPRSLRSVGTSDSKSEGNLSFGDLDKMMAEIDTEVATVIEDQVFKGEESQGEGSQKDNEVTKDIHIEEVDGGITNGISSSEQTIQQLPSEIIPTSSYQINRRSSDVEHHDDDSDSSKRALRQLHHQPASFPQAPPPLHHSNYDKLPSRRPLEQLKLDGIVPQDVEEKNLMLKENGIQKENLTAITAVIDQSQQQQQLKVSYMRIV